MALDIPEDYGTVLHSFQLEGMTRKCAVTYGIETASLVDPLADIAETISECYWGTWGTITDINLTLLETIVRVNIGDPDLATFTFPGPGGGAVSQTSPPINCCVLVSKNTSRGGRRNKGRMYVPNVLAAASVSEAGVISGGAMTVLQAAADDHLAALTTAGAPMYVLHNDPPVGVTPAPVTSLNVDSTMATQRRRMRG